MDEAKVPVQQWRDMTIPGGAVIRVGDQGWIRGSSGSFTQGFLAPTGYRLFNQQLVHILVARAYHGEAPTPQHVVDHINPVRDDNRAVNLRWVTQAENNLNRQSGKAVVQRIVKGDPNHRALWTKAIALVAEGDSEYDSADGLAVAVHASAVAAARYIGRSSSAINLAVANGNVSGGYKWTFVQQTGPRGLLADGWVRPGLDATDLGSVGDPSTWVKIVQVDDLGRAVLNEPTRYFRSMSEASQALGCREVAVAMVIGWPEGGAIHRRHWCTKVRQADVPATPAVGPLPDQVQVVRERVEVFSAYCSTVLGLDVQPPAPVTGRALQLVDLVVAGARVRLYEVTRGFLLAFQTPGRVRYLSEVHVSMVDIVCVGFPECCPGRYYWMPIGWFLNNVPPRVMGETQSVALQVAPLGHSELETQWAARWWQGYQDALVEVINRRGLVVGV
jgi:hypothetical protein